MEEVGITEDQLMNVRDRTLKENYSVHDIAQDYFEARIREFEFEVKQHGDDNRDADKVLYGEGPDLELLLDGETVGYVEVKSKRTSSPSWMCRCNRRHFCEYVEVSNEVSVPVFIWFALVDEDSGLLHRHGAIEIQDDHVPDGKVWDINKHNVVFREEDINEENNDSELRFVSSDDIIGLESSTQLVNGIPDVYSNDVVCFDPDDMRSFQWLNYCLREGE